MTLEAELVYYEPCRKRVGPVIFTGLKVKRVERIKLQGDKIDVSKIYDQLAQIISKARRSGKKLLVEARFRKEGYEVVYSESTFSGTTLIFPRPARVHSILVVRRSERGLVSIRFNVDEEIYVYEGDVEVADPQAQFVVFETEWGPRLLRRSEFRVWGGG